MSAPVPDVKRNPKLDNETNIFLMSVKSALDQIYDKAVFYQDLSRLRRPPALRLRASSASGAVVKIDSGPYVASSEDHATLVNDVKTLVADVAALRETVNELVNTLRGTT